MQTLAPDTLDARRVAAGDGGGEVNNKTMDRFRGFDVSGVPAAGDWQINNATGLWAYHHDRFPIVSLYCPATGEFLRGQSVVVILATRSAFHVPEWERESWLRTIRAEVDREQRSAAVQQAMEAA